MADIAAIRSALASRLTTLVGSTGQASAYWMTSPTLPTLQVVAVGPTEYDTAFGRGSDTLTATVQGLAGNGLDQAGQIQIDNWCDTSGSTSVKAAIETERPAAVTLGSLVSSCRVTGHSRPQITRLDNGQECWSVEFELQIVL